MQGQLEVSQDKKEGNPKLIAARCNPDTVVIIE
jgi:hypothetical protein